MKYFRKTIYESDNIESSFYQEPGRCFISIGVDYSKLSGGWGRRLFSIRFLFWEIDLEFYN